MFVFCSCVCCIVFECSRFCVCMCGVCAFVCYVFFLGGGQTHIGFVVVLCCLFVCFCCCMCVFGLGGGENKKSV